MPEEILEPTQIRWDEIPLNVRNTSLHPDMLTDTAVTRSHNCKGVSYNVLFDKSYVLARIADLMEQLATDAASFSKLVKQAETVLATRKEDNLLKVMSSLNMTKEQILDVLGDK